jgi:hypothetical protein
MKAVVFLTAFLFLTLFPLSAAAQSIGFGFGIYDVLRNSPQHDAEHFFAEYRHNPLVWRLRPLFGVLISTQESVYAYGGAVADVVCADAFLVSLTFAPGIFSRGNGKDLGYPLEFRSGIEVGFQFESGNELKFSLHHLSNGGLDKWNPGTETLSVLYNFRLYF